MNLLNASASAPWAGRQVIAPAGAADPSAAVPRPLRVLLVAPSLDPSSGGIAGVGHAIRNLLEAKDGRGELVCRSLDLHGDRGPAVLAKDRAAAHVRAFGGSRWKFSCAVLRAMSSWADLVIFTHVGPASLLLFVPRRLRPRCVVLLHGIEVWTQLAYRKRSALEHADLLISNSQFTADRAREFNPSLGPIHGCHLGISDQGPISISNQSISLSGPHDILIVARMSRFERYKGHAELIAALPTVLETVPTARLIVAGTGDDQPRYVAQASAAGVADRVIFTGFLTADELWRLYRRSALLAMPSRGEGFGLVYLEAMRAGLPCIASTADAAGEIVLHNKTGLLVEPGNVAQLAADLSGLLQDGELRSRLGAAGRQRFEDHFTEARFHERFWSVLESASLVGKTRQETPSN